MSKMPPKEDTCRNLTPVEVRTSAHYAVLIAMEEAVSAEEVWTKNQVLGRLSDLSLSIIDLPLKVSL